MKVTKKNIIQWNNKNLNFRSKFMELDTCHKMSNKSQSIRKYQQNQFPDTMIYDK